MARLRFFGGAVVEREKKASGGGISARRHPLALLALLACAPSRTLTRAKLAGLLWPDRPESAARNRLNSCIYNVRKDLGEAALITEGKDVRLGEELGCDVLEFREAVDAQDPARAADLYMGPLLDGFYLSDAPEFEKWLDGCRETYRRTYHEAVEELAIAAMEAGRPTEAVRHWRALTRDEPFDSRLAVCLVEALEAAGSTGAALRAGEEHVRVMREEFGREPGSDLATLLERIRRGASSSSTATSGPGRPPREAELRYVQGRGRLDERTEPGLRLAAAHFQAAIELHDGYAAAWAGLADALDMLRFYDYAPPENAPTPLVAARRALEIDPECGEGWAALGIAHSLRQEGPEAVRAFERAIELRPSHGEANAWLAWVLVLMGRPAEAVAPGQRASEIEPLAPAYRAYLAEVWLVNGELHRALLEARRAVEIQPSYGLARFMLALVEYHAGDVEAARAALEGIESAVPFGGTPRHTEIQALGAIVQPPESRNAAVRARLASLESAPAPSRDSASIGLLRAELGHTDAAFDAFAAVRTWRDFAVEYVRYFFPDIMAPVRADPRFEDLLETIDAAWGIG